MLALLPLVLFLMGCLEDQKRSMAQCREVLLGREGLMRTQRFAGLSLTISEEAHEIEVCMKAAGYDLTMSSDCAWANTIVQGLEARCYLPTNPVGRWMTMVEYAWAGEE